MRLQLPGSQVFNGEHQFNWLLAGVTAIACRFGLHTGLKLFRWYPIRSSFHLQATTAPRSLLGYDFQPSSFNSNQRLKSYLATWIV